MLIQDKPSFLKLLALDHRDQVVALGLQNVVQQNSVELIVVNFFGRLMWMLMVVDGARTAEEAGDVLVNLLFSSLHRGGFEVWNVGSFVKLGSLLMQPKVALALRLL